MTNLSRVRTARNETDREMHTHLAAAVRSLSKAEEAVGRSIRLASKEDHTSAPRAKKYLGDIRRAVALIASIGSLVPNYDHSDYDLLPEDTKAEIARQKREARKAQGSDQ